MQLSKVITNEEGLPEVIDVVPPTGWIEENVDISEDEDKKDERNDLTTKINSTLPLATESVEDLISELSYQLDIQVSTAYLTINPDGGYHVFLLIDQEDYHSTRIYAANLLAEKYTGSGSLAIKFTFTIQRQHIMSYMTTNPYKLKFVPEERRIA